LSVRAAKKGDEAPVPFWPVHAVWTLALNNELTHPPAFDEANGYFPIEGDRLVAYALADGTQLWTTHAATWNAPTAGGGFVFFVEARAMVALHASDGSLAWRTPLDDDLAAAPAWAAGWLLLATKRGAAIALRADDGHEIWRRDLGGVARAPIAVSADRAYAPLDDHRVVALQIESGAPVWERKLGGVPNDILALDDRLFVGSSDNYFYCLTTDSGRVDWRWRAGADVIGLPAVDERRVYFVSLDNVVRALNRSNGVQQWIQLLTLRPTGGPLRAGATVIVYGAAPPLRAVNAADGKGGGDIAATGTLAAPPHLLGADAASPMLIVVTRDIAKGDTVTLITRSVEPAASPVAALPNPVTAVPPLRPATGA